MPAILAALLLSSVAPQCELKRLDACNGMNDLVVTRSFRAALRAFIGPGRPTWLLGYESRFEEVVAILQGPADASVRLGDGLVRFEACYPHVCPIRASVYLTPAGRIEAVAVIHADCPRKGCKGDEAQVLSIFRRRGGARAEADARTWARQSIDRAGHNFPALPERLERVEIIVRPVESPR
jgi:hypothetical protein